MIEQGDEELITLDRNAEGWVISGKFFNEQGKIICEITKNVFFMNPGNYFRIDNTPNRLVVYNEESRPIIDIELVNESECRLTGDFFVRGGRRVRISKEAIRIGNAHIRLDAVIMPSGDSATLRL